MFRTLKFYLRQTIDPEKTLAQLVEFGYKRGEQIAEKGDFACRGSVLDIYAVNYESPARIEIAFNRIEKIFTFSRDTGKMLAPQNPLIVLPARMLSARQMTERLSINKFEELEENDFVVHIEHGIGKYRGITLLKGKRHIKIE